MTTAPRRAALAAAVAALVCWSAPLASAAESPTPSPAPTSGGKTITVPANEITFAIGTSDGQTADGRPVFGFSSKPGEAIRDSVIVYNLGKVKATFAVYGIDGVTDNAGGLGLTLLSDKQTGIGQWTTVGPKNQRVYGFVLDGGKSLTVPLEIVVPKDARPGDHVGGVVVSNVPPDTTLANGAQALTYATRLGVRTVVRVAGDLTAGLEVRNLASSFEQDLTNPGFGRLSVAWTLVNTGNVRVAVDQNVKVKSLLFGQTSESVGPSLAQLLPGSSVEQSATYEVFAGLKLDTTVVATPRLLDPGAPAPVPTEATTSTWAISWIAILIISLIVGLTWWLVARLRRRRASPPTGGGRHGSGAVPERPAPTTAGVAS